MKKINVGNLFCNNKFVLVFSVIIAFIGWIYVSSTNREKQIKTISDIPIVVNLSDSAKSEGLKIFSGLNEKASVQIQGNNRITMGMIMKDDIKVLAKQSASTIVSPGIYTLELTAEKNSSLTDYEFVGSISPHFITVSVDRERTIDLKIEDQLKYNSDPTYFAGSTQLSSPNVVISGPETKVSKIAKAVIKENIDGILKSTKKMTLPIILYDANGEEVSDELLTMNVKEIEATIPILYKKVVNISPNITGAPKDIDISKYITVNPSTLEIAGPEDVVKNLSEIRTEEIKFLEIDLEHEEFKKQIILPQGSKSLNNSYTVDIKMNMSGMNQKDVKISNISFINTTSEERPKALTDSFNIQVVGPKDEVKNLTENDIIAEVDLKNQEEFTGLKEVPVNIRINKNTRCWVYGLYTVNIIVEKINK